RLSYHTVRGFRFSRNEVSADRCGLEVDRMDVAERLLALSNQGAVDVKAHSLYRSRTIIVHGDVDEHVESNRHVVHPNLSTKSQRMRDVHHRNVGVRRSSRNADRLGARPTASVILRYS